MGSNVRNNSFDDAKKITKGQTMQWPKSKGQNDKQ